MKKIYILGANGFIGKRLTEKLREFLSAEIIGCSSGDCNLFDHASIDTALSGAGEQDVIVFASSITRLKENSYHSMIKNIEMAENLCCRLEKKPVSQVVFFSTVDVYGLLPDHTTIHEGLIPTPNDFYALSKITSEYLLSKKLIHPNIALSIFRLTGIFGPEDDGKSTINALVRSARDRGCITIFGDGENMRDFVHIDDLCRLVSLAIQKPENFTINVATGKSYPMVEIANMIINASPAECALEFREPPVSSEKRMKHMVFDIAYLEKIFPTMKFTLLEKTIKEYLRC